VGQLLGELAQRTRGLGLGQMRREVLEHVDRVGAELGDVLERGQRLVGVADGDAVAAPESRCSPTTRRAAD
jgi:hypothetical protein